ncbi:MAG: U32 family peptidase [Ruminococcus sp.]|nr:U32 family peptidase [Ruminococcus sp.]
MSEVLSPCGGYETLEAVLKTGTDAVYLGSRNFSARASAHNFDEGELERAVYECHKRGVKLYQAINTLVTDDELPLLVSELQTACKLGIDGIITQDLCLPVIVRECCPDLPIHASTQMTVHTAAGVEAVKSLGFCRAVLSRELPKGVIASLAKMGIETEVFVHGALCMSVSGQCYMSAVIGQRSANRGMCAQACRLPASAVKGSERYDLSLKDMSYIPFLKEIEDMGVTSLKIEGRMKRPEYVAAAANACSDALSGKAPDIGLLSDVFSRDGFTDGYYFGKTGSSMFGTRTKENVKAANEAFPKIHELYRTQHKYAAISFSLYAHEGEAAKLTACDNNGISVTVTGDTVQTALKRPLDERYVTAQLSKLGDTIYEPAAVSADLSESAMIPASALNAMRREACALLDDKRAAANTNVCAFSHCEPERRSHKKQPSGLRVFISRAEQLGGVDMSAVSMVCVPPEMALTALDMGLPADKLAVVGDRFTFDEAAEISRIRAAKDAGINRLIATNIAHIMIAKELGMSVSADFGLNITNSLSAGVLADMGAGDITLSFELKTGKLKQISSPVPVGVFAYGRLPLMLTANCPLKQAVGCKGCKGELYDRTGRAFKVKCSKQKGYVELLNSDVLVMSDKLIDLDFADFLSLYFTDETQERVGKVIAAYKNGTALDEKNMTRGLYYRGII